MHVFEKGGVWPVWVLLFEVQVFGDLVKYAHFLNFSNQKYTLILTHNSLLKDRNQKNHKGYTSVYGV